MIIGQLHHLGHSQATVLIPADVLAYGIPRDAKNIGNASHSYSHCIATENIFYFCHKFVVLVSPSARTETKTTKKIPCQNNSGRGQFYSDFCGSLFCDEKGQQTTAVEGLARAIFPPSTESAYLLVAPVNAKDADAEDGMPIPEFRIDIKAENKDATVDVDLKTTSAESYFSGSTMGKQFSIILKFTMGDAIAVQSSVTDWKTGGIAVGDIDESLIR